MNKKGVRTLPSINLSKKNYDAIIRMGLEPTEIVNNLATKFVEEKQNDVESQ